MALNNANAQITEIVQMTEAIVSLDGNLVICENDTSNSDVKCEQCKDGFKMSKGKCAALPDPPHCDEIEMTNPERKCIVCFPGYEQGDDGMC